ncbi:MAG TPA: tetratricopeptide repeat protein [Myxococcota bacterium]|nr:tetratricopeptide repeat protein [Myxococcota bacterium]
MAPALEADFTNWDDPFYVVQNPVIRALSPAGLRAIATTIHVGHYQPVAIFSYALDRSLGGDGPRGFHRTNLALHALCTLAVFGLALQLLGNVLAAFVTALLFAIHPMHVEAVAWISARKTLLATLFSLGCLSSYLAYLRRPPSKAWLSGSVGLYVLALLSSAMAAGVALVLPALDLLLGRRLDRRAVRDKVPFFALALVAGIGAIAVSDEAGALHVARRRAPIEQLAFAAENLGLYAVKVVAPLHLSSYYPDPEGPLPASSWAALVGVAAALSAVLASRRRAPLLAFAAGFFVANLIFLLQWIPVGLARMADRYTYLSYVGPFLLIGNGAQRLWQYRSGNPARGRWIATAALASLGVWVGWLGLQGFERAHVWRNSDTLWSDVIARYPDHYWAYAYRGQARVAAGDLEAGIADYTRSLDRNPRYVNAWFNRGMAHAKRGELAAAARDLDQALAIDPDLAPALRSRAWVRERTGDADGTRLDRERHRQLSE